MAAQKKKRAVDTQMKSLENANPDDSNNGKGDEEEMEQDGSSDNNELNEVKVYLSCKKVALLIISLKWRNA